MANALRALLVQFRVGIPHGLGQRADELVEERVLRTELVPMAAGAAQAGRRIFDAERAQVLAVEGGERFRAPVYRFVSTVTMAVEKFPPSSKSNSSSVCSRSIGFSPPELPRLYS